MTNYADCEINLSEVYEVSGLAGAEAPEDSEENGNNDSPVTNDSAERTPFYKSVIFWIIMAVAVLVFVAISVSFYYTYTNSVTYDMSQIYPYMRGNGQRRIGDGFYDVML